MTNRTNITYRPCQPTDAQAISDFLLTIGDELTIRDECEAAEMIALLFAKGGMLGAYREEQLIGVLGYFFGEPACNYANREIGFIYLAALAKPYRLSRVFQNGLFYTFPFLRELGVREVRFHAREHDRYLNRLYARIAQPLRKEVNRRGYPCILYRKVLQAPAVMMMAGRTNAVTSPAATAANPSYR